MASQQALESYARYAQIRDERNFTDYKVCKACGYGTSVTSNWKKGLYKPKWEKICKIAEVLDADPVWIDSGMHSVLVTSPDQIPADAQDYEDFRNEIDDNDTSEKAGYYLDDETAAVAQEIFENKELRALFSVGKDMDPEDLRALHSMALALKRKEGYDGDDPA